MSEVRVVVVLGGDARQRSVAVGDLVLDHGGTALILTASPDLVDPRLDSGDEGPVEVRQDDAMSRLESYRTGAADPDDDLLAALSVGVDGPLSSVLTWEYARRAAAAAVWDLVVVELDGEHTAVRRLAAAGDLAVFVEGGWPAHTRFAAIAAGERADTRLREAHRLAQLSDDVAEFLAERVEVQVVGDDPAQLSELADLVRGAVRVVVTDDGKGGYHMSVPVPGKPSEPVAIRGGRLQLELPGARAALRLPALLTRCVLLDSDVDERAGTLVCHFVPDPDLWPSHLVPAGSAHQSR